MKRSPQILIVGLGLLSTLNFQLSFCHAQGTAFTYSGSLSESNAFANGTYEFRFDLFGQASGGTAVAGPRTNSPITVSNGLFSVQLDFGAAPFDGDDRWLEIGVRKLNAGAFNTLSPRQQLTPLPYAITASKVTGPLPTSGLSGAYTNPVTLNNPANVFVGNGSGLTGISSTTLGGLTAGDFWQRGGNTGTTPSTHFLGTADNQALELKVNNGRALRLEPGAGGVPNLIVGAPGNTISPGVVGATIAGGQDQVIRTNAAHAFIGGGRNNKIETNSAKSVITGGEGNLIEVNADHATISGGQANGIFASSRYAVVAGGTGNIIYTNSNFGTIGGGQGNILDALSKWSTIGGGYSGHIQGATWSAIGGGTQNEIRNSDNATIAGGGYNAIGTNATYATVGGGFGNRVQTNASFGVVGGGRESKVTGEYGTIPGGYLNEASAYSLAAGRQAKATNNGAFVWADSTGGDFNSTTNNQFSVRASGGIRFVTGGAGVTVDGVPLGGGNGALTGDGSAIANLNASALTAGTVPDARLSSNVALLNGPANFSGDLATAEDLVGGRIMIGLNQDLSGLQASIAGGERNTNQAGWSFLGGGSNNLVETSSILSSVVGGANNRIYGGSRGGFIGGGERNSIGLSSPASTVGGGSNNVIHTESAGSTVAGGQFNLIFSRSDHATISGGLWNQVGNDSPKATIAGGSDNSIDPEVFASAIGGGHDNQIQFRANASVIGGGEFNRILENADSATIPGGSYNEAADSAFAAGRGAKAIHRGAFVWADSQTLSGFASTAPDQFLVRAAGGVGIGATNLTGALFLRHPVGAPVSGMDAQDNGLGLGQFSTSGYKWIQSYGGALALNPVANNVGIGTTNPTARLQVVNATCDGNNWVNSSDRNLKENFRPVDAQDVLAKVAALPIQTWSYTNHPGVKHVGPMAQDFWAAFGLGEDDKHIATVDADGVALAAIGGLNEKFESRMQQLVAENAELKERLARLERLIQSPTSRR